MAPEKEKKKGTSYYKQKSSSERIELSISSFDRTGGTKMRQSLKKGQGVHSDPSAFQTEQLPLLLATNRGHYEGMCHNILLLCLNQ